VTVTTPTGKTETVTLTEVEPGLWQASVKADEIGLYSASDGERTALTPVGPVNPREFADARSTPDRLAPVAEALGGGVRRLADADGNLSIPNVITLRSGATYAGGNWIGLRNTDASVLKGIDKLPLFAGLIGLALLLGALSITLFREGR